ncbi:hypothetical protein [Methylococcus sp. EFPC2]|uniref:hypothetical protein n=1 Tax=Methylococcus sp. EFPC2 TaxID=2812648 RepID=UPI001967C906|nr:hypothetical protein [Methylococcus sp. EFPC2]QSA98619.1 hypothetical protein JWZ97_07450 [Methylococcus sp. EFPC2]
MIEKFLLWISRYLKCLIDPEPFFETYFILPGVVLHHFVAPDPEQGFHVHPWKWSISIMLTGGYREEIFNPTGEHWTRDRPAGSLAVWGPNFAHRLVGIPGKPFGGWSLFITGPVIPRLFNWGYFERAGAFWSFRPMHYPKRLDLSKAVRGREKAKFLTDILGEGNS